MGEDRHGELLFERLRDVVVGALDVPGDSRRDYLRRVCGESPSLFVAAERLLAYQTLTIDDQTTSQPLAALDTSETVPARIGHYETLGTLGAGGMGVVYLALDPGLEREVAIKALPARLANDPGAVARFRDEALLLARLNHPNIATIYSFEARPEHAFITMEAVPGHPLSAASVRSVDDVIAIADQIAGALDAAHARGVAHFDLKPSNVLVTADRRVKVLDFGLARLITSGPEPRDPTSIRGTPGYMSPEQLRDAAVDHRADLWAFGCILFELATGQRFLIGSVADRLAATLAKPELLPGAFDEVPDQLRQLVVDCIQSDVANRIDSARTIRQALEEIQEAREVSRLQRRMASSLAEGHRSVPVYATSFVGRDRELTEVDAALSDKRCVALTGSGGTGKTRLAVELCHRLAERFANRRWFVDLATARRASDLEHRVLTTLGLPLNRNVRAGDAIAAALSHERCLLILDNCDAVVSDCVDLVSDVLQTSKKLHVIMTSRRHVHLSRGRQIPVKPLPTPSPGDSPHSIGAAASVRLLLDRAVAHDSTFRLNDHNAHVIGELCRRVDGVPLAIELLATEFSLSTPLELLENLRDRLDRTTDPDAADPHRNLEAVIGWSYEQLSDPERSLFRRLAVFHGGWTLQAAEAVGGDDQTDDSTMSRVGQWPIRELLVALVQKSLVVRQVVLIDGDERSRYHMLETIHAFAEQRLEASDEAETVRTRHVRFFSELSRDATRPDVGARSLVWVDRFALDEDNFAAALSPRYRRNTSLSEAASIARRLLAYWSYTNRRRGLSICEALLDEIEPKTEQTPAHARLLACAGHLARLTGETRRATGWFETALAMNVETDDVIDVCESGLSTIARTEGRYDDALAYATVRIERCGACGPDGRITDSGQLMLAFADRASSLQLIGRYRGAIDDLDRAIHIAETYGPASRIPEFRSMLAVAHRRTGDTEGAAAELRATIEAMKVQGTPKSEYIPPLLELGKLELFEHENRQVACRYAREAQELSEAIGHRVGVASALCLESLALLTADLDRARELAKRCLDEAQATASAAGQANAHSALTLVALHEERYRDAFDEAAAALASGKLASTAPAAFSLACAARAALGIGDSEAAARLFGAAEHALTGSDAVPSRFESAYFRRWREEIIGAMPGPVFERASAEARERSAFALVDEIARSLPDSPDHGTVDSHAKRSSW